MIEWSSLREKHLVCEWSGSTSITNPERDNLHFGTLLIWTQIFICALCLGRYRSVRIIVPERESQVSSHNIYWIILSRRCFNALASKVSESKFIIAHLWLRVKTSKVSSVQRLISSRSSRQHWRTGGPMFCQNVSFLSSTSGQHCCTAWWEEAEDLGKVMLVPCSS